MRAVEVAKVIKKQEEEWRVEDDMRTLLRAAKIKKDKKRMAAVAKMAKAKLTEMASLAKE